MSKPSKGPVRFKSQWALIGVIFFYTIGSAMIARHTKRIFKPASAGGSEHRKYSWITETPNQPEPVAAEQWQEQDVTTDLIKWDVWDYNLYYDSVLGIDLSGRDNDNSNIINSPFAEPNSEKDCGQEKKEVRQERELTRIQAQRKCVERVLRKAIIEPFYLNSKIKGLQISGLDEKTEADAIFLKNDDIFLAVNGQSLTSKKEAYDIFIKARKEPIMIIDLLQNGIPKKYLLIFE